MLHTVQNEETAHLKYSFNLSHPLGPRQVYKTNNVYIEILYTSALLWQNKSES